MQVHSRHIISFVGEAQLGLDAARTGFYEYSSVSATGEKGRWSPLLPVTSTQEGGQVKVKV